MEQQLPAGLSEGQIAEFVEDDEVEAREVIGEPSAFADRRQSHGRPGGMDALVVIRHGIRTPFSG